MLGLYLWHRETGDAIAMQACLRAANFFYRFFIDDGNPVDAAGAPAMNQACAHIFAFLYQETGEPRYLQMVQAVERAWVTSGGNYVGGFQQGESFFQGRQPRWESLHAVQAVETLTDNKDSVSRSGFTCFGSGDGTTAFGYDSPRALA
ncbi:hypothetical protein [Paenibacillus sp. NPDC055715]